MTATCKLMRKYLIMILFVLLLASLLSCNSSTSPKVGSLSGVVQLVNDTGDEANDPLDHSGVTIALYELANLDTIVTNARTAFPSVGFPIDQNSEFDHRLGTCIAETTSDASGAFVLSKVHYGTYNLVIMKSGWGFRYEYSVKIDGESSLVPIEGLILYPERAISGFIQGSIVLDNWRHLLVLDDVLLSPESSLSLGPNAVVRINPGKKLDIMGTIVTTAYQGGMFRVTSNDAIFFTDQQDKNDILSYYSLNLLSSAIVTDAKISWGNFWFGSTGLVSCLSHGLEIQNCNFYSSDNGFVASNSASPSIGLSVFRSIGHINNSLSTYNAGYGDISRNVIIGGSIGIQCEATSAPFITNNVLIDCYSGIQIIDSESIVKNNLIRGSVIGIQAAGHYYPLLSQNNVSANRTIVIGYSWNFTHSRAIINRNNLDASEYLYFVMMGNAYDIDATNNYHYTNDPNEIESKTYHKPDYAPASQQSVSYVIYIPFSSSLITSAGPQD